MILRRVLLLATVLVVVLPAPSAVADEAGLSVDGTTWVDDVTVPLFDPDFRWVPGDSETESFYVRNEGPTTGLVTIEMRGDDADDLLAEDDLLISARVEGEDWVTLENGVPSGTLTRQSIARGGVVRVDVNVTFDPASTNRSQRRELPLDFVVTLTDALEGGGDGGDTDGDVSGGDQGLLPGTGSDVDPWLLGLAVCLLVGGTIAVRRGREVRRG